MIQLMFLLIWTPIDAIYASEDVPLAQVTNKSRRLKEEDANMLIRHNPFYFAYGNPTSKIQLSFKAPIVKKVPLYFAYTQIMFWSLQEDSKPFRDLTYNPELLYRLNIKKVDGLTAIDFGIWTHNSNGKSDAASRSYDKSYIRAQGQKEMKNWIFSGSMQLSYLHGFDIGNKDIQEYIGPLSLSISLIQIFDAWVDKGEFSLQATPGGRFSQNWNRGGYQVAWSFRLGGIEVVPAFYIQYYCGYAESLLNYNRRVNEFRVGVIF